MKQPRKKLKRNVQPRQSFLREDVTEIIPAHVIRRGIKSIDTYVMQTPWTHILCNDGSGWWVGDALVRANAKTIPSSRNFSLDFAWQPRAE